MKYTEVQPIAKRLKRYVKLSAFAEFYVQKEVLNEFGSRERTVFDVRGRTAFDVHLFLGRFDTESDAEKYLAWLIEKAEAEQ